ncbi:M6 family metalloprotease domain-containing protein [Carboxylicivirga sp. RSCT41]|uniref:M6 family metalloprotease domain-containing protein n=1 Tax=Carboxylicivirga agarovorans TaxID=3417570 RepID=UPI003D330458
MQKHLLLCCLLLASALSYGQSKFVIGSPVNSEPFTYVNSEGFELTLFPGGDNTFHYILTEDNLPCIKAGNSYFYAIYKDGKGRASKYEIGTEVSSAFINKIRRSYEDHLLQVEQIQTRLKSIQLAPSVQSTGTINALLILVEYSDQTHSTSKTEIENLFNQPGSADKAGFKEFFQRASHGKLTVNVDVAGWYNCEQPYSNFSESKGMYLTGNLVRKAVDAAENDGIDFSKYDNNNDGKADAIIVMHAGLGADHRGEEEYIWPHSWSLSGTVNKAVTYDGVKIDHYVIACERRVYGGLNQAAGIGTFAHEYGHALGLPDMYDGTGKSNGLGHWALMSAGSWLDGGYQPSNFCAWSRYELGWEEPQIINYTDKGSYTLSSMNADADQVVRINTKSDDQYFLLENRRAENNDIRQPSSGLAIYQISKNKLALERGINDNRDFPAIRLLEADFDENGGLYGAKDRGVAGDLFAGDDQSVTIGASTTPSTNLFSGNSSGVELSDLKLESDNRFSFTVEGPLPLISWPKAVFIESPINDGSIDQSMRIVLEGDEFVFTDDVLPAEAWQVSNLPEGLSIVLKKVDANSLDMVIEGKAAVHESHNNVYDVLFSFTNDAFTTLAAENIQKATGIYINIKYHNEDDGIRLFVEDFENVTPPALPQGWEAPAGAGGITHWETVYGSNHTKGGLVGVQFYDKNSSNNEYWLVSPSIDLKDFKEVSLSFWQKFDLNGDAKNKVAVSNDKQNWTIIYNDHPEKSDQWEEALVKIPAEFTGQKIHLGFCIYEEQAWGWFWDDVSLIVDDYNAVYELSADKDLRVSYDDVLQTVSIKATKLIKDVTVLNIAGQSVIQAVNDQISVSHLKRGMYLVHVRMTDGSETVYKFRK